MTKLNKKITFLRTYPVEWPIFSTKNYFKDVDGWWNHIKKIRKKKKIDLDQNHNDIYVKY